MYQVEIIPSKISDNYISINVIDSNKKYIEVFEVSKANLTIFNCLEEEIEFQSNILKENNYKILNYKEAYKLAYNKM